MEKGLLNIHYIGIRIDLGDDEKKVGHISSKPEAKVAV